MVILSDNPLTVDQKKIKDIKVLKTIKDGQVIFDSQEDIVHNVNPSQTTNIF